MATITFRADFGVYVIEWGDEVAEFTLIRTTGEFMRLIKQPKMDLDTGKCTVIAPKRIL
jgi:hypothetical protein